MCVGVNRCLKQHAVSLELDESLVVTQKWPGGLPCKFGTAYQAKGLGIAPLKLMNLTGCYVAAGRVEGMALVKVGCVPVAQGRWP